VKNSIKKPLRLIVSICKITVIVMWSNTALRSYTETNLCIICPTSLQSLHTTNSNVYMVTFSGLKPYASFSLQKISSEVWQHKLKKWCASLELFKLSNLIRERTKQILLISLHGNCIRMVPNYYGVAHHVCRQVSPYIRCLYYLRFEDQLMRRISPLSLPLLIAIISIYPHFIELLLYSLSLRSGGWDSIFSRQLATGWKMLGSNPVGGEIFVLIQIGPEASL
jgi:hypothetical protein